MYCSKVPVLQVYVCNDASHPAKEHEIDAAPFLWRKMMWSKGCCGVLQ